MRAPGGDLGTSHPARMSRRVWTSTLFILWGSLLLWEEISRRLSKSLPPSTVTELESKVPLTRMSVVDQR